MKADLHELALSVLKTVLRNSINLQVDWILRSLNDHANAIYRIIDWGSAAFFRSYFGSPYFELLCEFQQPQVTQVLFPLRLVSIWSQTIADRRRSQRDLFPYNRRPSQTIAEPTVAIHFVQRKCHVYSRVVLAGKSKQTTWRTSRRKFCCKQTYFFF